MNDEHIFSRRVFLGRMARASGGLALVPLGIPGIASACSSSADPTFSNGIGVGDRFPLRIPTSTPAANLELLAAPGSAEIGGGLEAPAWLLNAELPSPLLEVRQGERLRILMRNQLPQDLILHWHGLAPPDTMDGHPRFAVGTGAEYAYDFSVDDRAGTYWYHSHTHMHTAEQTYRGIGGLLLVRDQEEDALGLPSNEREIPLILQDRRVDGEGRPVYQPFGPVMMAGHMGPEPFGNGIRRPYLEVETALYRFRILNGSNARIFRLGRSDGRPLILIGNDGGLLREAVSLASIDLGPAERADILVDLRSSDAGDRLMLRSLPFEMQGGMGFMGGANLQGDAMELLELRVARAVTDDTPIPGLLSAFPEPDPAEALREREFRFTSMMMNHAINGRPYEMERIDEVVPFGETEIWTFVNDSNFPHPIHLHATHFRVLSRTGGRARVFPWEEGRKDTVLLHPFESVRVALRFTAHRGLYLLHCHNLEHEDMGMMANILVE